ncbi:hypothetical protein HYPSUDRAFT_183277 [Hypholoma sublateritium FD-334 SS-4]|uniref:Fe2OG dioxygenase domain-containing protein n=1 Tax=Hypholoma sublateritium (strain FD-334 SS-4) TaxID=945553 RepID=A0A0D2Q028_HYPSF|nr:hypothetical protein HYPSUDRAFT_183277 [Hypholoma sublateritium FD-334 SS-4]
MEPVGQHLAEHRLSEGKDVFYFPNFITTEEEEYLIRKINDSPQPQWKKLASRRLQIWGGDITAKGNLLPRPFPPFISKYPDVIARIKATGAFENTPHKEPNHVIINEYLPGQGIMPHEDGPQYHPVVATLSLGSHTVFHYYQYRADGDGDPASSGHGKTIDTRPTLSVILEPRSLIISSGAMYTSHLHGIEEATEDIIACTPHFAGIAISNLARLKDPQIKQFIGTGTPLQRGVRYSLTCRDVGRVLHLSRR